MFLNVLLQKCVVMYFVCLECGVDVDLWWEGGSATALTDFQHPPPSLGRTTNPPLTPPILLTPAEAIARFNIAFTKQTQTTTVLHYVACKGLCKTFGRESMFISQPSYSRSTKKRLQPTSEPLKTLLTAF